MAKLNGELSSVNKIDYRERYGVLYNNLLPVTGFQLPGTRQPVTGNRQLPID